MNKIYCEYCNEYICDLEDIHKIKGLLKCPKCNAAKFWFTNINVPANTKII